VTRFPLTKLPYGSGFSCNVETATNAIQLHEVICIGARVANYNQTIKLKQKDEVIKELGDFKYRPLVHRKYIGDETPSPIVILAGFAKIDSAI
jgi:hypothetical protein